MSQNEHQHKAYSIWPQTSFAKGKMLSCFIDTVVVEPLLEHKT